MPNSRTNHTRIETAWNPTSPTPESPTAANRNPSQPDRRRHPEYRAVGEYDEGDMVDRKWGSSSGAGAAIYACGGRNSSLLVYLVLGCLYLTLRSHVH